MGAVRCGNLRVAVRCGNLWVAEMEAENLWGPRTYGGRRVRELMGGRKVREPMGKLAQREASGIASVPCFTGVARPPWLPETLTTAPKGAQRP